MFLIESFTKNKISYYCMQLKFEEIKIIDSRNLNIGSDEESPN